MAYINATFSPDFGHFLLLCLSGGTERPPTVHDAVALVSGRMMTQFAQTQWHEQALRAEMYKEMENGRLLRLLSKVRAAPALPPHSPPPPPTPPPTPPSSAASLQILLVSDRDPEMEGGWAGAGDSHLLKLFRESLFGAVDDEGGPVLDFAQIVAGLNRLDAGVEARVLLSGREDNSLLLVSHRDVKSVLERGFGRLVESAQIAKQTRDAAHAPGRAASSSSSALLARPARRPSSHSLSPYGSRASECTGWRRTEPVSISRLCPGRECLLCL